MNVPVGFVLKEKVADLEKALLDKHPRMPTLLQEIWGALKAQPENVTLMTEEEISLVVKGLQLQTNTFLAESISSGSKKSRATSNIKALIAAKGEDAF